VTCNNTLCPERPVAGRDPKLLIFVFTFCSDDLPVTQNMYSRMRGCK
jgi:hypothetical protein